MFDFKSYPEINNCHKKKEKLRRAMYKAESNFDRSGSKKDDELWELAIQESQNYSLTEYSENVYIVFNKIQPLLYNRRLKKHVEWKSVFKDNFNKLSNDEKIGLVCLVEEDGGIYRLPAEYYVQK